ncbi:MAG: dTDP-4-dehydrorhamnose reductase [Firmicutes bacterium]|nr:dTDP-4-dehydrorhamnose reductase [Bacillota bacterium]
MKIMLIGSSGQLSFDLMKVFKDDELIALTHQDLDVTNRDYFIGYAVALKPDVIINTAAFHKVDVCEDERQLTFEVNCFGAANGALAAEKAGAKYVFYSTDYVFGADTQRNSPYIETDFPGPVSVYGNSKLAGEIAVRNLYAKHFVIRSTGLYGLKVSGKGYNFPGLMMKLASERDELKVVNDQRLTPTFTKDIAEKTAELIKTDSYGLYHMTGAGDCTWYEFTKKIFDIKGIKTKLTPVTSDEFPTKAKRPGYSVLDNKALRDAGLSDMRPWDEALQEYLFLLEMAS